MFSAPMVRAILAGRKTQTRRVILVQPPAEATSAGFNTGDGRWTWLSGDPKDADTWDVVGQSWRCPYGVPGESCLWVRETWRVSESSSDTARSPRSVHFRADPDEVSGGPWRSGRFMPRWASRITLELTDVRVQRLQEISEEDARAEGVEPFFQRFPNIGREQRLTSGELAADAEHRASYAVDWDTINGHRALWSTNPWVWALTFRRMAQ